MTEKSIDNTWQENPGDIIILVNHTKNNYVLELPSGRYRLDAGRRMRTLKSIMKVSQIKELVSQGKLVVE